MKIHELKIEGFKSIGEIRLVDPNPFSVFVGPNGSGKSNIFEGLELLELCNIISAPEVIKLFGNSTDFTNQSVLQQESPAIRFSVDLGEIKPTLYLFLHFNTHAVNHITFGRFGIDIQRKYPERTKYEQIIKEFKNYPDFLCYKNFTRLFVRNSLIVKQNTQDDSRLASDASNLEKVLKRILKDENNREEIMEILQLLIPGFSNVEIITEELSGSDNMVIYEDALKKPLTKRLISDGTYNILAIIAAIFQSEEPQFLCIEEPENGLNPKVVRELVTLFRNKCQEKGHYIWLNTHSQTLVSELTTDEIILVDKVDGNTRVKQVKGMDLHGMKMDEALLTNALGGGIPW